MTTAQLEARIEELTQEVAVLRAEVEALRKPDVLEFASRVAGRPVSREEFLERGREFAEEFEARFGPIDP